MKKAAFVLGYAGAILALIFSLLMIYVVPSNLLSSTIQEIENTMDNSNLIAFNEMALAVQSGKGIASFSESGFRDFAQDVAKNSQVLKTKRAYNEVAEFLYGRALGAVISMILVGVSIIFALVSFIGSLVLRKAPRGGGVMMLIGAFILLLTSIYTETILMMLAAILLLTLGGIFIFVPQTKKALKPAGASQRQFVPAYPQYGASNQVQYPQIQYNNTQPVNQPVPAEDPQYAASEVPSKIEVPFPEEEQRSVSPEGGQDIKQ